MLQFIWEHLAIIGFASLMALFLVSFFFRTAWGHWHAGKGRGYKKPTDEERRDLFLIHKEKNIP